MGLLILSKNYLRKGGCLWLIKFLGHVFFGDVRHFNTPPHVSNFDQTHVQHRAGKCPSSSKELVSILWRNLKYNNKCGNKKEKRTQ